MEKNGSDEVKEERVRIQPLPLPLKKEQVQQMV